MQEFNREALRAMRIERRWSQFDVSLHTIDQATGRAAVRPEQISKYERGEVTPDLTSFLALVAAFQCEEKALLKPKQQG